MNNAGPTDVHIASQCMAPSGTGATGQMRIASLGATPLANATALVDGSYASLVVGSVAVRIAFGATAAEAIAACSATSLQLQPGGTIPWIVTPLDRFVACREGVAAAGATEAWVWTSSGPRSS